MKTFPLGVEIKSTAKSIHHLVDQILAPKLRKELTGVEGMVMIYLFGHTDRELGPQDIISFFQINKSSTSELLTNLEKKGLIVLSKSDADKRRKIIDLTSAGEEMRNRFERDIIDVNLEIEKGFSEEELTQLRGFLQRIRTNCGWSEEQ